MNFNKNKHSLRLYLDSYLLISLVCVLAIGLIMVASSSLYLSKQQYGYPFYYFFRQCIYCTLGLVLAYFIMKLDIAVWQKYAKWLLFISIFLLCIVLIPGIGVSVNGSRRWVNLFFVRIQVSELVKLFMIIYMANYIVKYNYILRNRWLNSCKPLLLLAFIVGLLLCQPDFGAAAVILSTVLIMLFLGGMRWHVFALLAIVCLIALTIMATVSPYRLIRITSFLNPWEYPFSSGYQLTQSLIAFGSGGWFGLGLGASIQKLFYLPEAHTDFIYAVLSEELGVIGALSLLLLYCFIGLRGIIIAIQAQYMHKNNHAFIAFGISFWIMIQVLINIGVNVGLLPTKGITLPLVSYGGGSLIVTLMSLAVLLRINAEINMEKIGASSC